MRQSIRTLENLQIVGLFKDREDFPRGWNGIGSLRREPDRQAEGSARMRRGILCG